MSAIDQIFDPDNCEPIILYNEKNEEVAFEQIAVIPLDGAFYVILQPAKPMEGVAEDEALVMVVAEEDGEEVLQVEERDEIIDAVFREYYIALEEAE